MAMQDIRKLAHEMLDELDEEEIPEVIQKMLYIKKLNKRLNQDSFPSIDPTDEDLRAIKKAKREFQNGESYTHEDVFGEDDYV
ncbi:hypothetical protein NC661_14280 [Aquibacillus koreensis]|uniref:Uncharacterized protein n=1 Tax=Aquibacillus koreensis TaxID=279446 RepID=A0A9X4AKL2_9BACI|nr:hypothetical protein [Aquibacillus koreensis]MCT2536704.1 hypothetical protein [Aquibacillus koreensis]MDC3421540.1 hypothetical protein [Aquibacillus koreensis]